MNPGPEGVHDPHVRQPIAAALVGRAIATIFFVMRLSSAMFASAVIAMAFAAPAEAGFPDAVEAYDQGDYATTFAESRPLAERGDIDAQYMLGYLYARGEGVRRDLVKAYLWYALAARQGDSFAADAVAALVRRMSGNQLTEARALADAWQPAAE